MSTLLFGKLNKMLPIPYPESGMTWDLGRDSEETALISGGRHVYRAPTAYRRYSLNYAGGTAGLQNLIDIHGGVYGPGPFYVLDFNYTAGNVLPSRWASGYLLRYVAESWCAPWEVNSVGAFSGTATRFSNNGLFPELGIEQIVPAVPNKALYLRVWGARTGGAVVRASKLNASTGNWVAVGDFVPSSTPDDLAVIGEADAIAGTFAGVKLELVVPTGSTLTLDHLNLSTTPTAAREVGKGVGAVDFTGDLSGTIVTKRYDRIGLSLDIIEVE